MLLTSDVIDAYIPILVTSTERIAKISACETLKKTKEMLTMRRYAAACICTAGSGVNMLIIRRGIIAQSSVTTSPTATANCVPTATMRRMLSVSRLPQYCADRMSIVPPMPPVNICRRVFIWLAK